MANVKLCMKIAFVPGLLFLSDRCPKEKKGLHAYEGVYYHVVYDTGILVYNWNIYQGENSCYIL